LNNRLHHRARQTIVVSASYPYVMYDKVYQSPTKNPYQSRHGLTRQGQKIRTVKPRLTLGKVALHPELGKLASCQPDKQARA